MSSDRARVMREAGERFDRAEAAKRAEKQVIISRMNRTLAHPDPIVRAMAGRLLTPNSRAAAFPSLDGPSRAGRAAKSTSTRQDANAVSASAGEERRTRPGNPSRYAHLAAAGDTSRFAAFAAASDADEAALAALPRHPAGGSPEQVAAFIMGSAAKARGQKVTVPVPKPAAAKPDMSTPEGIAKFVGDCAAKARGGRQTR